MSTVNYRNHHDPFACVSADSAGVVADDSTAFHPAPVAAVKVHVGSADVACLEIHEYLPCFNFWVGYIFNFDVVWSMVYSGFQKGHYYLGGVRAI